MPPVAKDSRPRSLDVLAAGPWDDRELAAIRHAVDPSIDWPTLPSLAAACDRIEATDDPPELILLAQPRPGAVNSHDVERLRSLAPLTRLIVVAGSWCEGELRSGQPLPGVIRLYWHELPAWWRVALARRTAGECPPWSGPLDDLRAGQLIREGEAPAEPFATTEPRGQVVIDALDYHAFDALAAALATDGWQATWQPRRCTVVWSSDGSAGAIAVGIWDGGQLNDGELAALTQFCSRCAENLAPVLVLLDYPRHEHLEMIRNAGAATLLGKPYQLPLLLDELNRVRPKADR